MAYYSTGDNNFGTAKWIVDPTPGHGTHTTIATALVDASSGDTIFIRPGTYTENLTLKTGVNIVAWSGDDEESNVIISGKATYTGSGTVTIANIRLQTNSDFFLVVSGSSASIVNLNGCYLNCTNNTGISFTTSNASARILALNCEGDLGTTGIGFITSSSAGIAQFIEGIYTNTGASTTASTASAGSLFIKQTSFSSPFSTTGTAAFANIRATLSTVAQNVTSLTCGGSGTNSSFYGIYDSGTASAISVGNNLTSLYDSVTSSNTNAITGGGTLSYVPFAFYGSSANINTTTQTILNIGPSATLGSSNSGNTNTLTITNSSNTASSGANVLSSVGGSSASDATYQAVVSGVTTWTWGTDNSVANDPWVLAASATLGSSNVLSITTAGVATFTGNILAPGISFDSGTNVLSSFVLATTFTPVLAFGGASVGITYTTRVGKYQRVGNMVYFTIFINLSSKGSSTGAATITGLPVTAASDSSSNNAFTIMIGTTIAGATGFTSEVSGTSLSLQYLLAATGANTGLADTNFTNTSILKIQGHYFV
jgi:hypothetical protein